MQVGAPRSAASYRRLRCTGSPSCRKSRCTRLALNSIPSRLSSATAMRFARSRPFA